MRAWFSRLTRWQDILRKQVLQMELATLTFKECPPSTGSYNLKSDILCTFNNMWLGNCWSFKEIWSFGLFILTHLGLNNIPICTVNDDEKLLWGVGQFGHLEKDEMPFAKCSYPPSTAALESPVREVSPAPNSVKVPPRPRSGESSPLMKSFLRPPENYQGENNLCACQYGCSGF